MKKYIENEVRRPYFNLFDKVWFIHDNVVRNEYISGIIYSDPSLNHNGQAPFWYKFESILDREIPEFLIFRTKEQLIATL